MEALTIPFQVVIGVAAIAGLLWHLIDWRNGRG